MRTRLVLLCSAAVTWVACGGGEPGLDGGTGGGQAATGGGGGGGGASASFDGGATSGFVTAQHGFSFENYTNDNVTNLTPAEVSRLFGPTVCASMAGGTCILTPAAQAWMAQANEIMNGGHCFGFSHLALNLFKGRVNAQPLGGAQASALQRNNELVQREIAYWMATQLTAPANTNIVGNRPTPQQLLLDLASLWARNEYATLAFFTRAGSGGHAVTPHSIRTLMDGTQELIVYDNNFPNVDRVVRFNPANDSWSYSASINPTAPESQYEGDALTRSIFMVPIADAAGPQQCPFCGDFTPGGAMAAPRTVGLSGTADVMIEDGLGHSIGTVGRALTNTFPGARANVPLSADLYRDQTEPQYVVPGGAPLRISIDGSQLQAAEDEGLSVVGPGYALGVFGLSLDPAQRDVVTVSGDGQSVRWESTGQESPTLINSFSTSSADFVLATRVGTDANGALLAIDRVGDEVHVRFASAGTTTYDLVLQRIDGSGLEEFLHQGTATDGDVVLVISLSSWAGQGSSVAVGIDDDADGTVESTVMLDDQN